jgi:hypothetical protein
MARSGGGERSGAHPEPRAALCSEHGEDGEHRTFPAVGTMAHLLPAGGPSHHTVCAAAWRAEPCRAMTIALTRASRVFSSSAGLGTA